MKRRTECGRPVRIVLDGEEWCDHCQRYQRPREHGWSRAVADKPQNGERNTIKDERANLASRASTERRAQN